MLLLRLLILSAEASFPAEPIADPLAQLIALAQYASSLELPTNSLRNHSVPMNTVGGTDHIFVNANLARGASIRSGRHSCLGDPRDAFAE